jgi:shikimate dehydrogenase
VRIDGNTGLVGIIGDPLAHTISPAMHNAAFEALGLNLVYVPLEVDQSWFHVAFEGVRHLGFVGLNVTMPYKEQALEHLDEVASFAQMAGAVNTVHVVDGRMIGYNTDGRGVIASLDLDGGFQPKDKKIVIVGAGGAASATVLSLCLGGAASVTIVNRSPERAAALVTRLGARFSDCEIVTATPFEDLAKPIGAADLIVNATPTGMRGNPGMPVRPELLRKGQLVLDMIYDPPQSEFLAAAKAAGAKTLNGLSMLVHQGASALEIWTECEAPVEVMRAAAEAELARIAATEREEGAA